MLRRLGIRAKVLAVLAVPIIVLLAAGAYISANAIQKAQVASASSTVVATLDAYAPLSAALTVLFYFDLRVRKEGFDLERLAGDLGRPLPGLRPPDTTLL